MQFYRFCR